MKLITFFICIILHSVNWKGYSQNPFSDNQSPIRSTLLDEIKRKKSLKSQADSLYQLLTAERRKYTATNKQLESLRKRYNEVMDSLILTEFYLEKAKGDLDDRDEFLETVVERVETAEKNIIRARDEAISLAKQRDKLKKDLEELLRKESGFEIAYGVEVRNGKSVTTIEEDISTGEITYKNPLPFKSKLEYLKYRISWALMKSSVNEELQKLDGYIVIYEDNKFLESHEATMTRVEDTGKVYHLYKDSNPALKLINSFTKGKKYKFAFIQKEVYEKNTSIITELSFWEICRGYKFFLFTSESECGIFAA